MRRTVALLVVLTWSLAACGGGDDGGTSVLDDDGTSSDDAGAMTRALALVPDTDGNGELVIVGDYAGAGEAVGLDQPEPGADEDELADWFIPLGVGRDDVAVGLQINGLFQTSVFEDAAWRAELGWAPADVDIAVETAGETEHSGYYGFLGDFDPDTIDEAVNDPDNPYPEAPEHEGDLYTWGEDDEVDVDGITPVRDLGRGGRMAVIGDDTILWAWATEPIEDGIATVEGEQDSLADSDTLGPLAAAMDDADAVGALFGEGSDGFIGVEDSPHLEPYEAYALGVRVGDDQQPEMLITLVHEDDAGAEANAEALESVIDEGVSSVNNTAWSDQMTLEEVTTDGPVLTAVLEGATPGLWLRIPFARDSLLAT